MKIDKMSLKELNFELKRARFWLMDSSIKESIKLINKMEIKRTEIIKKGLDNN